MQLFQFALEFWNGIKVCLLALLVRASMKIESSLSEKKFMTRSIRKFNT